MLEMPGLTSLVSARSDHNVLAKQNTHTLHASNSVRVHVNKDNLALTPHPFKVVSVNNLVSLDGKDAHSGHAVFMRVHPCDVLGEGKKKRFKCTCRRCDASSLCISALTPALTMEGMMMQCAVCSPHVVMMKTSDCVPHPFPPLSVGFSPDSLNLLFFGATRKHVD